jgi:hypothetical protein
MVPTISNGRGYPTTEGAVPQPTRAQRLVCAGVPVELAKQRLAVIEPAWDAIDHVGRDLCEARPRGEPALR